MSNHKLLNLFVIAISLTFRGSNGSPLDEKCFNETQEEFSLAKNLDSSQAVVVVDIKYGHRTQFFSVQLFYVLLDAEYNPPGLIL